MYSMYSICCCSTSSLFLFTVEHCSILWMWYSSISHSKVDGYLGLFPFCRRLLLLLINVIRKGKNIYCVDAMLTKWSKLTCDIMLISCTPRLISWEGHFTTVIFFTKIHTLRLIMRKFQTTQNLETSYKISDRYSSRLVRSGKTRKDSKLVTDWRPSKRDHMITVCYVLPCIRSWHRKRTHWKIWWN